MRKLFVLLLVALVPVMIGCRLVENDDTGADVQTLSTATASSIAVAPKVTVPGTLVKTSISALDVTLKMPDGTILRVATYTVNSDTTVTLTFQTYTASATALTFTNGAAEANATLYLTASETVAVKIPVFTTVSTTTDTVANNTVSITITTDATTGALTVTVSTTPDYGTVTSGSGTSTATAATIIANDFYVVGVNYASATVATLTADPDTTCSIDSLIPLFKVTVSTEATIITNWTFETVNVTDTPTSKTTWSDATNNTAVTIATATNPVFTFQVNKLASPLALEAGKTYKVTFTSTITKKSDATKTITSIVRYFKTASTAK